MTILKDLKARRTIRKYKPLEPGSASLIPYTAGFETVTYEVAVDLIALEAQAIKAATNKKGTSRDGAIIVHITRREPVETAQ